MDNNAGAFGCAFLIFLVLSIVIIQPAAFGGAVEILFDIDDMSYGQKFIGGLSGLALPMYFVASALHPYVPSPIIELPIN